MRRARTRRLLHADSGFGLPEVMVAMGVVVTSLILLAHTVTVTLSDVGLSRQRQGGNAIANGTIEQARAVPHDTLRKGLRTDELAGDPEIVDCGGGIYRFRSCSGELIVHTAGLPDAAPLVPHRTTQTPTGSPTSFDVATYVTAAGDDPATDPLRVIVIVSWDQVFRGGVSNRVEVETIVYSPTGCVDHATHPFSGPCRPYFFGTSSASKGAIRLSLTVDGSSSESAVLDTVSARADGQLEQVQHVQGAVSAAGVAVGDESFGGQSASSTADDDPASPGVDNYDSNALNSPGGGSREKTVAGVTLRASRTAGNGGATTSATAAGQALDGGGTQLCPTTTPPGPQNDAAACGHNWSELQGALETQLAFSGLSGSLGSLGLATPVSVSQLSSTALLDKQLDGGDGILEMSASRSVGDLRLGGLPSGVLAPLGWQGFFVRLDTYQDQVSAAAGQGAPSPSAVRSPVSLQIWNGTGYSTVTLAAGGSQSINTSANGLPLLSDLVDVSLTGSLTSGTAATQEGSATSGSPLLAEIQYSLKVRTVGLPPLIPSQELLNVTLDISLDLGQLYAQASYREASVA